MFGWKALGAPAVSKDSGWCYEVVCRNTNSEQHGTMRILEDKACFRAGMNTLNRLTTEHGGEMDTTMLVFHRNTQLDDTALYLCKVRSQEIKWDK